ncbi:MAG: phosphoribosylamine--glycine ligase [Oscillospiraceae bacterium]|nr:phosphoribosylamine--glycine ligase [Oscillospiraceae bacterium]
MRVLVVGSGGREHTLIRKLKESPLVTELFCAPGNGGISADATCLPVKATDITGMVACAKEHNIDFCVVAPDDPLAMGMVDRMEAEGIKTFGPTSAAAAIESSKVFSKNLMKKYGIPTAGYEVFDDPSKAIDYIAGQNSFPAVIKADGLALGKGVIIAQNLEEAKEGVASIMEDKIFGKSGDQVVVEEFLTGPEVSVLCFTDGKTYFPMVSSMDHKRVFDNDQGPNTGGMGTIAPNPFYTEEIARECAEKIFKPTIEAMNSEGRPFKGCLYFGLMLTPKGPKVIEYNCRFGDPETQVVLPLLETDLMEIMLAIHEEKLDTLDIKWNKGAAACVVMASGGYPGKYPTGLLIGGLDANGQAEGVTVIHAGTKLVDGTYCTGGGRVLGVTAVGADLEDALNKAYAGVEKIHFENAHYRKDIGRKKL